MDVQDVEKREDRDEKILFDQVLPKKGKKPQVCLFFFTQSKPYRLLPGMNLGCTFVNSKAPTSDPV